jgi:hypothetical protein
MADIRKKGADAMREASAGQSARGAADATPVRRCADVTVGQRPLHANRLRFVLFPGEPIGGVGAMLVRALWQTAQGTVIGLKTT